MTSLSDSMPIKKGTARSHALKPSRRNLFLFVFFLCWFDAAILCSLGFGLFHRLLGLSGLLGAGFGAFLALFVEDLLDAEQFEESLVGAIALVPSRADDARVSAIAIAKPGTH